MKRRNLECTLLILALLLSLLSVSAFAAPEEEKSPLAMENVTINEFDRTYYNDGGTVINNFGTVYNNGGTVYNNGGTVYNNGGVVYNNGGIVHNNGAEVYNNGGIVHNNGGIVHEPCDHADEAPAAEEETVPAISGQEDESSVTLPEEESEDGPELYYIELAGDYSKLARIEGLLLQPDGSYDISYLFQDVEHYIKEADYALCCFEGAMCGEGVGLSGYPMFYAPDGVADSLKKVGFDLVALASNHGMDGGQAGLIRTIDCMERAGLDHIGTYRTQEERDEHSGVLLREINGIRIAFLDYSYGTNGIPIDKFPYAMNVFCEDYMTGCSRIRYDMIEADMTYAKSLEPDVIAVIMHWGAEYICTRQRTQTELADYLFAQGADLVLGGHPHVPQPMETRVIDNGDGTTRVGYLCYCLGNLAAHMHESSHQNCTLTALAQIELEKDPETQETRICRVEYVPMVMMDQLDYWVLGDWRFRLLDLHAVLDAYIAGDDGGFMTDYIYNDLSARLKRIGEIMGPELVYDVAQTGEEAYGGSQK